MSFSNLQYDNKFVSELSADPNTENRCRQVHDAHFSRVQPVKVRDAKLVAYSEDVLSMLGLEVSYTDNQEFVETMVGNKQADGMDPYAMCYGGHQFGNWAGQLGDGRAINLGEILNANNERWALQLKGAGPTPYSRNADGYAVLRSSIREYLCSEAMHHLGVPTTRALSLAETGEGIVRDMLYDGNVKTEPGAIVCRVAPSFIRFGHFQIHAARNNLPMLKQLLEYTLKYDFPHLGSYSNQSIALMFKEVCASTAHMIAHWMRVGFVHGVMNTDNMSILGLTIDYGPYGWLDDYDPDWTPNTTDAGNKRYRYVNQPAIAHWNLTRLAEAIVQLTEEVDPLKEALEHYSHVFSSTWKTLMLGKLGIADVSVANTIIEDGLELLQKTETDMTLFFRNLASVACRTELSDDELVAPLMPAYYKSEEISELHINSTAQWIRRLIVLWNAGKLSNEQRQDLMNRTNPKYVLRNYISQLAIDKAEEGDYAMIKEIQTVLKTPYDDQDGMDQYAQKRPDWARNRAGCSMLSCSS